MQKDCLPTASNFGAFVYCGAKFFFDKDENLAAERQKTGESYDKSLKTQMREWGQQNEPECIDWLLKKYNLPASSVIYDGTAENAKTIQADMPQTKTRMQCKPDLLLEINKELHLYEFKSVSDTDYLKRPLQEHAIAQVWCYRYIQGAEWIKSYNVFRYAGHPFLKDHPPKINQPFSHILELHEEKFISLFQQYIEILEKINKKTIKEKDLTDLHRPQGDARKCNRCYYYKKNKCTDYFCGL